MAKAIALRTQRRSESRGFSPGCKEHMKTFNIINPATGAVVGAAADAGADDARAAI